MKIVLLLVALTGFGDFRNQIALEAAKAKLSQAVVVQKVPRSTCEHCKGTGKIAAGDGVTKVVRECDRCFDDSAVKAVGKAAGAFWDLIPKSTPFICRPVPEPKKVIRDMPTPPKEPPPVKYKVDFNAGRKKRIVIFDAPWCVVCASIEKSTNRSAPLEMLEAKRWKIGRDNDQMIQLVDTDEYPHYIDTYKIEKWPTMVLMYDGHEFARKTGFQTATPISGLWNAYVSPSYLREWARGYTGDLAYTEDAQGRKVSNRNHLLDPNAEEHHYGGPFQSWQLIGLSESDLDKIHGGQHASKITPYGEVK